MTQMFIVFVAVQTGENSDMSPVITTLPINNAEKNKKQKNIQSSVIASCFSAAASAVSLFLVNHMYLVAELEPKDGKYRTYIAYRLSQATHISLFLVKGDH